MTERSSTVDAKSSGGRTGDPPLPPEQDDLPAPSEVGSGSATGSNPPAVTPRELRRIKKKHQLWLATLLTLIFVVIVVWTNLPPQDRGGQLGIVSAVLFDDLCIRIDSARGDKLHVTEFEVSDAMMARVKYLDSVETLIIDKGAVSDQSIHPISAMPRLRHLRLRLSPITDEGLETLAQCETLWYINLPHADCTAEGVAALSQLPRLRQLRLGSPGLGNEVTEAIALIESLRGIHLIGVAVTDEGLKRLAAMPHLESLYLDDAKVTEAGWEWLFKNYPQLHVHVNQDHHDHDPKRHAHHD